MASSTKQSLVPTKPVRAVLKNLLWVNYTKDLEREAKRLFHLELFKDDKCEKCEYASMRPCDVCEGCDNYLGSYKLFKIVESKTGVRRIGVPVGDEAAIKQWLGADPIVVDKRAAPKFSTRIRFTAKLNDPQIKPVRVMMDEERGILEAPPRAGKTVMATYISCKLGLKTLIITNQYDYLAQFYETICGSDKEAPMTDAAEIEKFEGRKIVGYAKHPEDMAKYDIVLATYQSFISKRGRKRLRAIQDMFGLVVIDECWTYGHQLRTDQGLIPIGQIVEQRLPVRVLSHNHETGRDEYRAIESVTKKKTRTLVKITVDGKVFMCTPNHEWWSETRQTYVAARDIQPGETVRCK